MNNIYHCKVFLRKRLNMTKVIGWLWGNGSLGLTLLVLYITMKLNHLTSRFPGTVFFY
jgi:hypothetical protein